MFVDESVGSKKNNFYFSPAHGIFTMLRFLAKAVSIQHKIQSNTIIVLSSSTSTPKARLFSPILRDQVSANRLKMQ